jgi:dTDP-4-amino-4,6-dideoxy-D-galactose acyltransferase
MINTDSTVTARFLEWDSSFFGKRIARVNGNFLNQERVDLINTWGKQNAIDCLYFLASSEGDATVICAEQNGYHLVDLRITLSAQLKDLSIVQNQDSSIRYANESDILALKTIAGLNHTNSRFFTDQHFDREKCRSLYEIWIEKCVRAPNGHVFVWEDSRKAIAYVSASLEPDGTGKIELVGISPEWQGKGIGKQLISAAQCYFAANQVSTITTVTQGRNIHAIKLYQKCGFFIQSIELWYHKWIENPT